MNLRSSLVVLAVLVLAGCPKPPWQQERDGSCTPHCGGKECGNDGCGASCGTCEDGTCDGDGMCVPCTPDCSAQECGLDPVCGRSCGSCDGGTCTADGVCQALPCTPACSGKACGDNGCGERCGTCPPTQACQESTGRCLALCDLEPGVGSVAVNLDVRLVAVQGVVRFLGLPQGPGSSSPGMVTFRHHGSGTVVRAPITAGNLHYATHLLAGNYDVGLDCTTSAAVPRQEVVLFPDQPLQQDTELNLDVPVVHLQGQVLLNGGNVPEDAHSADRGDVVFRRTDTLSELRVDLGVRGTVQFNVALVAGRYDVDLDATTWQTVMPEQRVNVLAEQPYTEDQSITLSVQAYHARGQLTVNGQPLPSDPFLQSRGSLLFRRLDTNHELMVNVHATGAVEFDVPLLLGLYDVEFQPGADQTVLAHQRAVLATRVPVAADTALNLDLVPVTLSGNVTLDGQPLPEFPDGGSRGQAFLRRQDNGVEQREDLGATGPGSYAFQGYEGLVDVGVDTLTSPVLPRGTLTVLASQPLGGNMTQNLDLLTVNLDGEFTLDGAAMPTASAPRGTVALRRLGTQTWVERDIPGTGLATWSTRVFPGIYDVGYRAGALPAPQAGQVAVLEHGRRVDTHASLPLDVSTATLHADVNLDTIPTASRTAVTLQCRRVDTGDTVAFQPPASGSVRWSAAVLAGSHDVEAVYTGNSAAPAQRAVLLRGCLPPWDACTASASNVSGHWYVRFTGSSRASQWWELTQSPQGISGRTREEGTVGWRRLLRGQRSTTEVDLTLDGTTRVQARVVNGCMLVGYTRSTPPEPWVAERVQ